MVRRNSHVIRREHNVLEVDFSREPDPPAPRFPGASGLRELTEEGREAEWSSADFSWTLAGRKSPPIGLPGAGELPHGGRGSALFAMR
jgi:hypothetical protein